MTSASFRQPGSRTVLITGAGRGLGLGLAKRFAERGDRVIGTVRNPEAAAELSTVADAVVALDMTDDESIAAAGAALGGEHRVGHLDLVINNAGINATAVGAGEGARGPLDIGRRHFLEVMDVNVGGPMVLTQALVPLLRQADGALVLNVSSQLGAMTFGGRAGNDVAYNASKAALNMLTVRTASTLEGDNVAFVAIHPGWVRTDMGGEAASLGIDESSAAIAKTVDGLTLADSGRFMRWDGTPHDW